MNKLTICKSRGVFLRKHDIRAWNGDEYNTRLIARALEYNAYVIIADAAIVTKMSAE